MSGTQEILDLDKLNSGTAPTFAADNFATISTPQFDSQPGGFIAFLANSGQTWADDSGAPWLEGGTQTLTYSLVAGNTEFQVVTIAVTNASGDTVATIYGQVVGWTNSSNSQIDFQGFQNFDPATGVLSDPLGQPGVPSYFALSAASLEGQSGVEATTQSGSIRLGKDTLSETTGTSPDGPGENQPGTPLPCFAAGTAIATPSGPVAVETLAAGDAVLTVSGAVQTVRWAGRTTLRCDRHANPARVTPVRVERGAFGRNLPARALYLSPEHAVLCDGVLVPVQCLVNGTSITQPPVQLVSYCHIELSQHDVVLAEGLPAESYLETGARLALTSPEAKGFAAA